MKIEGFWRKGWLCLFVVLLSCCTRPPDGPVGIMGDSGCVYHDESLPEERRDYVLSFEDCKNHIATSPDYFRVLLQAYRGCTAKPPGPMCVVGDVGCECFDSTPPGHGFSLTFGECLNYVVTTIDYFRILTQFYERRCAT